MGNMQRQEPLKQSFPANWYLRLRDEVIVSSSLGRYFGSLSLLPEGSRYVTPDLRFIVIRSDEGVVRVFRNACSHGGFPLIQKIGLQEEPKRPMVCEFHRLSFSSTGEVVGCPGFIRDDCMNLQPVPYVVWNDMILGFDQYNNCDSFDRVMSEFGKEVGVDSKVLSLSNYQFVGEVLDSVNYPLPLFVINYRDLLHVKVIHPDTFGMVADTDVCKWEISDPTNATAYCIQRVMKKQNYRNLLEAKVASGRNQAELGWANLLVFLEDNLPADFVYPLDPDIFALWVDICGSSGLMLEVYCGGLFMAVSHVYNIDPTDPRASNENQVQFFIHRSLPAKLVNKVGQLFIDAYQQSADEDTDVCEKVYMNHLRHGGMVNKFASPNQEKGEEPYYIWCKIHFLLKTLF